MDVFKVSICTNHPLQCSSKTLGWYTRVWGWDSILFFSSMISHKVGVVVCQAHGVYAIVHILSLSHCTWSLHIVALTHPHAELFNMRNCKAQWYTHNCTRMAYFKFTTRPLLDDTSPQDIPWIFYPRTSCPPKQPVLGKCILLEEKWYPHWLCPRTYSARSHVPLTYKKQNISWVISVTVYAYNMPKTELNNILSELRRIIYDAGTFCNKSLITISCCTSLNL